MSLRAPNSNPETFVKSYHRVNTRSRALRSIIGVLFLTSVVVASLVSAQSPPQREREFKIFDNLTINVPPSWSVINQTSESVEMYAPSPNDSQSPTRRENLPQAGMLIIIERRHDHAEALRRLAEIASEYPERATPVVIAGWPAIERRYRSYLPQSGEDEGEKIETSFGTTAIAVAAMVIRFNTILAPNAESRLLNEALTIARSLSATQGPAEVSRRELIEVERMTRPPQSPVLTPTPTPTRSPSSPSDSGREGVAVDVLPGRGELEIASNDGAHVVVATNAGYSFSDNFGTSFTAGPGKPCTGITTYCDGDPTLAVGQSGHIYYGWVGGPASDQAGDGVSVSIDNGHTFTLQAMAATCPDVTGCHVADQPHIAADRNNASTTGQDRIYNVWRVNLPGAHTIRISCSSDSGITWTGGIPIDAGDFPRVTVSGDGSVYVAYESGSNMMLRKYSACDAGLAPEAPVTVAGYTEVPCPVPGLDRCQSKNTLSSPTVAADDLDPTHIYYAFATSTGGGNEDVMVYDSVDSGASFTRSVRVNTAVTARRYMPWLSTYGGIALVSWYDRRTMTMANNDLTRFRRGGAAVRGPNLEALIDQDVSGVDDQQCSTWPCVVGPDEISESCSVQPQLAGRCRTAAGTGSTNTPCDFSSPACPMGETCLHYGSGCTKYGDYNGNTAGAGRLFSAWASSVPPPGATGAAGTINVYSSADQIRSDFYVRDWNDGALFDNGAQPSTRANFWSTSDVWNQSTNVPSMTSGFVLGDPPDRGGSNFAYARVSRRAPAMSTAPEAPVTVNFLRGDYGMNMPFVAIGSESVTLAAGDITKITPAHSWIAPADSSIHLCLAVQLEGPDGDTFALPSVAGTAPGPADPLILIDNNKAQRNLQDTIGTADGVELIAMVRNQETSKRLMQLRIKTPPNVRISGVVDTIGGTSTQITNDNRIVIGELEPGEVRWLRFQFASLVGVDQPTPIDIFEDSQPPANGFTILLHRDSIEHVMRRNLLNLASVLARLAEVENNALAKKQGDVALQASTEVGKTFCMDCLSPDPAAIKQMMAAHLRSAKGDPFGIEVTAREFSSAVDERNVYHSAALLTALIERLDAHLTMLVRERGTTDDIIHNVQWQKTLFTKLASVPSAAELVNRSQRFLDQNAHPSEFPKFIDSTATALDRTAVSMAERNRRILATYAALRNGARSGASPARLQRLHRDFLLEVQKLTK